MGDILGDFGGLVGWIIAVIYFTERQSSAMIFLSLLAAFSWFAALIYDVCKWFAMFR